MAKIEGRNPIIEALKGNRNIEKILLQKGITGEKIKLIITKAGDKGIPIERVSKTGLDKLAGSHAHQGVMAFAEQIQIVTPREILDFAKKEGEPPFIVILDQIQDPHNFGSIIRTACAAGVHGIIYQDKRAADITPVVVKSSAGALEHILLSRVTNINNTIDQLKEEGLWIAGADIEGDQYHYKGDLKGSLGLVIGSEGSGLRRLVKEKCDFLIKIPMPGKIDSLNASVAAAVVIYEAVRQRE